MTHEEREQHVAETIRPFMDRYSLAIEKLNSCSGGLNELLEASKAFIETSQAAISASDATLEVTHEAASAFCEAVSPGETINEWKLKQVRIGIEAALKVMR